jgi:hypothetical protein
MQEVKLRGCRWASLYAVCAGEGGVMQEVKLRRVVLCTQTQAVVVSHDHPLNDRDAATWAVESAWGDTEVLTVLGEPTQVAS